MCIHLHKNPGMVGDPCFVGPGQVSGSKARLFGQVPNYMEFPWSLDQMPNRASNLFKFETETDVIIVYAG